MSEPGAALAGILRRDRLLVVGGLVALIALAWLHLWLMASGMHPPGAEHGSMGGMDMVMPATAPMGAPGVASLFGMWTVMMAAMMLPSAAPMTLLFASIQRRRRERASPAVATGVFVAGYLVVWTAFSAVAATAQVLLHDAALLSPMMASTSSALGAGLLILAGVYQWTPLKNLCLTRCRTPLGFLTSEWREGREGALVMGMRHGAFCLGCCWALMALLFVAGVMNLLWVAVLAMLVLAEKVVPRGDWIARAAGVVFAAAGVWMLLR